MSRPRTHNEAAAMRRDRIKENIGNAAVGAALGLLFALCTLHALGALFE
jgi:hypothetical protein